MEAAPSLGLPTVPCQEGTGTRVGHEHEVSVIITMANSRSLFVGLFFVAVCWFCTLHLAVNFMFVPLVRNRFAHTLHPAPLAFVSYGII